MPDTGTRLAGFIVAGTIFAVPAVHACGYHSAEHMARGLINWAYPKALYVRTAVWQAEQAGILPPREPSKVRDLFAYRKTVADLRKFGDRLSAGDKIDDAPVNFTVVLLHSMLWTRFVATPEGYSAHVHVDGPQPDDVVMVTDGKVIQALVEGSLDAVQAETHGLLRLYRQPQLHQKVRGVLMNASIAERLASETLGVAAMKDAKQ
jgi:hypothetical protein